MTITFAPATKKQAKGRIAFVGGPGTGKTYSALALAQGLAPSGRIALIDTEHGSASKYAGDPFTFDTLSLDSFDPRLGVEAIKAAEAAGYEVIVIDSLSHFWMGKDGALEQVDRRAAGNKFTAWREVTPMHTGLVEAILQSKAHVIATMRAKVEYVVEVNDKGKSVPRKVGLAPVQREGVEFEFDVVGDIDQDHNLRITKTRCRALTDQVIPKPGAELAATLRAWLSEGAPAPVPAATPTAEPPSASSSMGIPDPVQIRRVVSLIDAARSAPEGSTERRSLDNARLAWATWGYDKVSAKTVSTFSPKELAETERLLAGEPALDEIPA